MKTQKSNTKHLIPLLALSALISIFIMSITYIYNRLVVSSGGYDISEFFTNTLIKPKFLGVTLIVFFIVFLLVYFRAVILPFVFKYRYLFAAGLFIICVINGISGSSIGSWLTQFLGEEDHDILLGISRPIRSDEWAVSTPMAWSQYAGSKPFSYFSDLVRASRTDVFLEYGQPVLNPLIIYRPFYIGYLFLPVASGMSFFWCGRLIALFMVSFEFGRLITKDDRKISLAYAFLISLAPSVQWWFAVNGLVEMIIYAELSILMMTLFMKTKRTSIRILSALIIVICAGGYILTMYPPWMIPIAYVLLAFIIWTFVCNKKNCHMRLKDWCIILGGIVILVLSLAYIYHLSKGTIIAMLNTAYPGNRSFNGGGDIKMLFESPTTVFMAITNKAAVFNTCESATVIDFFPLCYAGMLISLIKTKKADLLSVLLFIVSAVLGIYCVIGLPDILSKISFLSNCQPQRALVGFGFCNLLIFIRGLYLLSSIKINKVAALLTGIVSIIAIVYISSMINVDYYSPKTFIITITIFSIIAVLSLLQNSSLCRSLFLSSIIILMCVSGGLVNPIIKGVDSITNSSTYKMIKNVDEDEPGTWVILDSTGMGNIGLLAQVKTMNSVHIYPDMDRWHIIDSDGTYEEIYNRYAHITVQLTETELTDDKLTLLQPDCIIAKLSVSELKKLGADYILSRTYLDEYTGLEKLEQTSMYKVYKIRND